MAKKPKNEKVIWVDDGRTLADMSGVTGPKLSKGLGGSTSTAKEKWDTYWSAVKMMFIPMLTVIVALCVIYMILYAVFFFAA